MAEERKAWTDDVSKAISAFWIAFEASTCEQGDLPSFCSTFKDDRFPPGFLEEFVKKISSNDQEMKPKSVMASLLKKLKEKLRKKEKTLLKAVEKEIQEQEAARESQLPVPVLSPEEIAQNLEKLKNREDVKKEGEKQRRSKRQAEVKKAEDERKHRDQVKNAENRLRGCNIGGKASRGGV